MAVFAKDLADYGVSQLSHLIWRLMSDLIGTVARQVGSKGVQMSAPRLRSLPRNVTDTMRALVCVDGAVQDVPLSGAGSMRLERTTPIREFFSWPGKRNYEGLYWSSTNRRHVDFESLLEREYLLAADYAPNIVAIAAQPLALLWPRATRGNRDKFLELIEQSLHGTKDTEHLFNIRWRIAK